MYIFLNAFVFFLTLFRRGAGERRGSPPQARDPSQGPPPARHHVYQQDRYRDGFIVSGFFVNDDMIFRFLARRVCRSSFPCASPSPWRQGKIDFLCFGWRLVPSLWIIQGEDSQPEETQLLDQVDGGILDPRVCDLSIVRTLCGHEDEL